MRQVNPGGGKRPGSPCVKRGEQNNILWDSRAIWGETVLYEQSRIVQRGVRRVRTEALWGDPQGQGWDDRQHVGRCRITADRIGNPIRKVKLCCGGGLWGSWVA